MALAHHAGIPQSMVSKMAAGKPIPHERCPDIERISDGEVTVEEQRPDLPWLRIPDPNWPHPGGRPLLDIASRSRVSGEVIEAMGA